MKSTINTFVQTLCMCTGCALAAYGQGTFQNLDFESANVSGYPRGSDSVPVSAAFPGWNVFYSSPSGTNAATRVSYDAISLGGALASINDSGTGFGFAPLEGSYSAFLFGGGNPANVSTTLSQTGLVPSNAQSLQMEVGTYGGPSLFTVSLGGQYINMVPLASYANYVLYGGNISALAGQGATLNLTAPPPAQGAPSFFLLDDIVFSTESIPEPGVLDLSALGALLVGWRVLRRR
jgi:hypothetical protein